MIQLIAVLFVTLAALSALAADLIGTVPAVADGDIFTLCAGVGAV